MEFIPVEPGNPNLEKYLGGKKRYVPLHLIKPFSKGMCKWCNKFRVKTIRHLYCDANCRDSAEIFCYPQRATSKKFHSNRQGGKCKLCEVVFNSDGKNTEPELDHVNPIFRGGLALGWKNHHLICHLCHKNKTVRERKESKERSEMICEVSFEGIKLVDYKF